MLRTKPLRRAGSALSGAALGAAIVIGLVTVLLPKLLGATPYTVLTGSMRPTMEPGTLAIVRPVDPAEISLGDVVTYQIAPGRPEVITHRVVGVGARPDGERTFATQGDANTHRDPDSVRAVQVRGVVAYTVPWMGYVNSAVNRDTRSTLVMVVAGGCITYGLWLIGSELVARRRPRTKRSRR